MDDDFYQRLMRMFPGDLPEVSDEDTEWPSPTRLRRPPVQVRYVVERPKPVAPDTAAKFKRLMESGPARSPITTAASAPARQYLLEAPANVTRWLDEARDIESDVKLGQSAEPHQVTRLLLEAIPVVEQWREKSPASDPPAPR